MMTVTVDCRQRTLTAAGHTMRCAIGRGGAVAASAKREGDGATPLGDWRVLGLLLRPDAGLVPPPHLPWRWLRPTDGWSDTPEDPAYNHPVSHPHGHGAERLWRDDALYDVVAVLDHNQHPVVPGAGSAIFWHVAAVDFRPTEGCVAIDRSAFAALLGTLPAEVRLCIHAGEP